MALASSVALLTVGAALQAGTSAAPGDGAQLSLAVQKAATSVTSFRATATATAIPGFSTSFVFVKPDRVRFEVSLGAMTVESVAVGTTTYTRSNGGPWVVSVVQNQATFAQKLMRSFANRSVYTVLPDRQEAGVTYGAFSTKWTVDAAPAAGMTDSTAAPAETAMDCTYDKATYFLHACTSQFSGSTAQTTIVYSGWNDQQNAVSVPADAPAVK